MATQSPLSIANLTDEQFGELARTILVRELGAEGLARFLNMESHGVDYTRDRHLWQDGATVSEVLQRIRQRTS